MNEIKEYSNKMFKDIKHIVEFSNEYWLVRKFIDKQGGTTPEELPTPNKSLKEIKKKNKQLHD